MKLLPVPNKVSFLFLILALTFINSTVVNTNVSDRSGSCKNDIRNDYKMK